MKLEGADNPAMRAMALLSAAASASELEVRAVFLAVAGDVLTKLETEARQLRLLHSEQLRELVRLSGPKQLTIEAPPRPAKART